MSWQGEPVWTPGKPFKEAWGITVVEVTASSTGTASAEFPEGRFTVAPCVNLQIMGGSGASVFNVQGSALTADGFTVNAIHRDSGGTATATVIVHWQAVQMTPTSGEG